MKAGWISFHLISFHLNFIVFIIAFVLVRFRAEKVIHAQNYLSVINDEFVPFVIVVAIVATNAWLSLVNRFLLENLS